jgi:hypothetical protein
MPSPIIRAVTRNGRTHYVEEPAPRPPLTPDEIILRVVAAGTGIVVTGALIWSTVSVGAMLATLAPAWAAYMIAAVFDLGWIIAMGIEYVLRFEPHRQKIPKAAGWIALAISMSAIFTHGALHHARWIGFFGALISALAKGMWWLLMFATTRRLDRDTQAWLTLELNEVHARRAEQQALAKVDRERGRLGLDQTADQATVHVDRSDQTGVQTGPASVHAGQPTVDQIGPAVVQPTVQSGSGQPDQIEEQVNALLDRLKKDGPITKRRAAEILGIPESTAYRRLKDAEALHRQYP